MDIIKAAGAVPGIKVDAGAKPLAAYAGETVTEGLDGLRDRLNEYYGLGARFAKWRGVIAISSDLPTGAAVRAQRPCPRPLRGAVPGSRHCSDRRAGNIDGRRTGRSFPSTAATK